MTENLEIGRVQLPVGLSIDDLLLLYDRTERRVAAVLHTKPAIGRKGRLDDDLGLIELPVGIRAMALLPSHIAGPWGRLTDAIRGLLAMLDARAPASGSYAPNDAEVERVVAHEAVCERWRALEAWIIGWTHSAHDGQSPGPEEARWLLLQLFPAPTGLRFLSHCPSRQWGAMKPRMKLLATARVQAALRGLGGQRLYQQLLSAYERFGEAYGFLAAAQEPEDLSADSRPEFAAAKDSLCEFVRRVECYGEPAEPGSEALSRFLLVPYADLVSELTGLTSRKRPPTAVPPPIEPE